MQEVQKEGIDLYVNSLKIYWLIQDVDRLRKSVASANELPNREKAIWYMESLQNLLIAEQRLDAICYVVETDRETLEKRINNYFKEIGFV
jgi:hypothetical protein